MSGYTKGPWSAELGEVHEVRDTEGGRICILTQLRGRHGLGGRRPDSESPANARIIAAAPELLETIKKLRHCIEGYREDGMRPDEWTQQEWIHWCDEAIAKAVKP